MSSSLAHYAALSRRSIVTMARQPTAIVPPLAFPLLFLALSAAAFEKTTRLPGFPAVDSFAQFMIATTIVQGALFGSIQAGADMATDIERGFFDRLLVSPVTRSSLLVGRVAGAATLGFLQSWFFFVIAVAFGVDVEGGVVTMALVAVVSGVLAAGIGAVTVAFALRTGSNEAVEGTFPLIFASVFLSSAFFPRGLMNGWFKSVADLNPLSHLIEALREQVVGGVDLDRWLVGLGIALGIFAVGAALSSLALRGRLLAAHQGAA